MIEFSQFRSLRLIYYLDRKAIMTLAENPKLREIQGKKNRKIVALKHNQDNEVIFGQLLTELQCNEVNA